jgi:hypothetical protein
VASSSSSRNSGSDIETGSSDFGNLTIAHFTMSSVNLTAISSSAAAIGRGTASGIGQSEVYSVIFMNEIHLIRALAPDPSKLKPVQLVFSTYPWLH